METEVLDEEVLQPENQKHGLDMDTCMVGHLFHMFVVKHTHSPACLKFFLWFSSVDEP